MKKESEKIELVKRGVVAAICKYGVTGASVARIAAMAGVSDGYLYRHYDSKEELIDAVLDNILNIISNKIEFLLENCSDIKEIIDDFMDYLYENSQRNSDMIKFLIIFQNDFTYEMRSEMRDRISTLCKDVVALGKSGGQMRDGVTHLDLYMGLVALPLQFLALQYKGLFLDCNIEFGRIKDSAFNLLFKI